VTQVHSSLQTVGIRRVKKSYASGLIIADSRSWRVEKGVWARAFCTIEEFDNSGRRSISAHTGVIT
jgi:hypothetical protein